MNTKQAKQLDFPVLLEKMGYYPIKGGIKKGGNEIWYRSPLNANDKTPSFHLTKGSQVAWVFKCFSTGAEGTVIDFVIAHEGYGSQDIKSALTYLRGKFPGSLFEYQKSGRGVAPSASRDLFSFHREGQETLPIALAADRELEYLEDLPLKSGSLLNYLEQKRKIPSGLAQQYLRLVRYKNLKNGKNYYALGMKNRAGGFEIRAASDTYAFKSALIARDISVIPGQTSESVSVFEGSTDFLSFLVMMDTDIPPHDAIILHSVNSYTRCCTWLRDMDYQYIHTFLDNDETGEKYTARFQEDFGDKVIVHSASFAPFKDLNDALKAGHKLTFFSVPGRPLSQPNVC
ncbi:MAG: toprim domain-containing protein [Saprospiraceae bacterium]|nr:toprim domain-containing protein [Lewinella sp.]